MKDNTKKKAPKVSIPHKKKPFAFEKQSDTKSQRKSPMLPMKQKRLSK